MSSSHSTFIMWLPDSIQLCLRLVLYFRRRCCSKHWFSKCFPDHSVSITGTRRNASAQAPPRSRESAMEVVVADRGRGPGSSVHFMSLHILRRAKFEKCFNQHMASAFKDCTKFCVTILEFRISPTTAVQLRRIFSSFHP